MITCSDDKTLRVRDLKTGAVLKKMEGHSSEVRSLGISRDGRMIASGDNNGEAIAWHGETGKSITHWQPIEAHANMIYSLDFSPDGMVLATATGNLMAWDDTTVKFWCTKTWQMQGEPIECGGGVCCVRYSPSGELLAIATDENIQIYNSGTREEVIDLIDHTSRSWDMLLAWTPDGTRLLSTADDGDEDEDEDADKERNSTIIEWDSSTWQEVGHPWIAHTNSIINAIAIHPGGDLVVSASTDNYIRLWQLSHQRTIAIFQHSSQPTCVTFSVDGKHILSGDNDNKIWEWAIPKDAHSKILDITTARDACVTGDLSTAEELLTQDIDTDANDFILYAHRAFVMARKHAWDHAFEDAIKSIDIRPSLTGYISKGIALCGKGHILEARIAFDGASMFTNQDSATNQFLILTKAIALFNADQHKEAMLLIKELATACPNVDPLARHVVETYLRVQLGIKALNSARHDEAADHLTATIKSGAFSSKKNHRHQTYEDLIVLFGWDLESLLLTAHQKRCQAFLLGGKPDEALEAHKCMMEAIDESAKTSCLDWSNDFKEQCNALAAHDDRILGMEIPGQDQDGYDAEPNFFHGMHQSSQISQPRPQQRAGRLKRFRLAMTSRPQSDPTPAPAPPTTSPPPSKPAYDTRSHGMHCRLLSMFHSRRPKSVMLLRVLLARTQTSYLTNISTPLNQTLIRNSNSNSNSNHSSKQ